MTFKKILVATDFSASSAKAMDAASRLAEVHDARISLCHALEAPDENTLLGGSLKPLIEFSEEQRKAEAALRADAKRAGLAERLEDVVVRLHQPGNEVPELAKELGCDLIVVGSHGRTGLHQLAIGSVTDRIVRHSTVPVLVVPLRE